VSVKQKLYSPKKYWNRWGVSVIVCSQTKGVKPKFRGRKLRSAVYWQGASKQEDVKQVGRKTGALHVTRGDKCEDGRGAKQGWCLSPILFDWYSECLAEEALERFGDFRMGQVILTVKYADGLLLLAEEETVLLIDRLIGIGVEMNAEKKLSDTLTATIFNRITIDKKKKTAGKCGIRIATVWAA
jgi:hypothetical protein